MNGPAMPVRRAVLGGLAAVMAGLAARAGTWPEKTITWLLPFPVGGPSDTFARPVAAEVAKQLGQPVVIENRSGAGGTLGAAIVAQAAADGYTMLIGYTGLCYAPLIYPSVKFDLMRDFVPISAIDRVQETLVVNPRVLDVSTLQQFLETAKRKPESIDVASGGLGTVPHLAIEMLQARAGIRLHHVPYRGGGPALQDLLGGQVAATFGAAGLLAGYVRTGKLRAIATAGRRREPLLPDVPTMAEAGLAGFHAVSWDALFAPRGTPEPVLDRMHAAVQTALGSDAIRRLWAEQGAKVELESRADFTRFVGTETGRWDEIVKAANVRLE
jgi:tripartite-type tricarboxylate transporter receptor subunit TctC